MRIIDLSAAGPEALERTAQLLRAGFAGTGTAAWQDLDEARAEVEESLAPGRSSRVAVDEDGTVLGWIGGISHYDGHVWELHPLVVHPEHRRQGIGRALVLDLEAQVCARGGLTLWLGTDDEDNRTSLGGVDLYPDPLAHLAAIRNVRGHPFTFYQKLGFALVGVMPDASGFGKPDIYMAKRVGAVTRDA
jgi:aminoglycoside 6'-N-acetyltransferase I